MPSCASCCCYVQHISAPGGLHYSTADRGSRQQALNWREQSSDSGINASALHWTNLMREGCTSYWWVPHRKPGLRQPIIGRLLIRGTCIRRRPILKGYLITVVASCSRFSFRCVGSPAHDQGPGLHFYFCCAWPSRNLCASFYYVHPTSIPLLSRCCLSCRRKQYIARSLNVGFYRRARKDAAIVPAGCGAAGAVHYAGPRIIQRSCPV